MFDRLHPVAKVLERARDEAAVLGSQDLEAEHILLALAAGDDPVVHGVLTGAGLDRDALRRALEAQEEAALASVGVSRAAFDLPPRPPLKRTPGWSTSAKQAMIRAKTIATARHEARLEPPHLLIGVLRAEAGPVPRALAFASADPRLMAAETETALAGRH